MLQWPTWSSLSRHSHSCRRATKAGQTTLGQAKIVLTTSRILSQATKVRLRCKRVDFLGTANNLQWPIWSSSSRHSLSYRMATMTGQTTLEQTKTVLLNNRILSWATEARLRYKRVDFLGTADFENRLRVMHTFLSLSALRT